MSAFKGKERDYCQVSERNPYVFKSVEQYFPVEKCLAAVDRRLAAWAALDRNQQRDREAPATIYAQDKPGAPENVILDIRDAAKAATSTYKSNGTPGLVQLSRACYERTHEIRLRCIHIDVAARRIELLARASENKKVKIAYFEDPAYLKRVDEVVSIQQLTSSETEEYLKTVESIIDRTIDSLPKPDTTNPVRVSPVINALDSEQVRSIAQEAYRAYIRGSYSGLLALERQCWRTAKQASAERDAQRCGIHIVTSGLIDQTYARPQMRGSMPGFTAAEQRERFLTESKRLGLTNEVATASLQSVVGSIPDILAGLMLAGMR